MKLKLTRQLATLALVAALLIMNISVAEALATGPAGPKGATGPAGPKGATGPAGPKGATGPAGPTKGATGPQGPIGLTGAVGAKGDTGAAGATGPMGPEGPVGATGPAGSGSTCSPYLLGDTGPDGGKIYYLDGTGCHGLEAQAADASSGASMDWATAISTSAAYNTNATNTLSGYSCSTTNAQLTPYCWHLPTKTALEDLYEQKTVVGGFANGFYYWSSSELNFSSSAWGISLDSGNQDPINKSSPNPVRAVRAF